ncbi:MAG: hypothetical protein HFG54_14300 [Lachnospiraceae bacterium]|jgi:hypothetical protein|nr:hypothetical protein [Lachnospiraceae bacterium]
MAYRMTGRKTGTVTFTPTTGTIIQETLTRSSKMTSNAIEGGSSVEDHVYLNPEQFQIEGIVVKNHSSFRSVLESMWRSRDLVTYVGKIRVSDYVITNIQFKNDATNKKGFEFTATLQKANIVSGQYVEMGEVMLMSQQDAAAEEKKPSNTAPSAAASKSKSQTSRTKSSGLKTTASKQVSQSAYAAYVNSYNGKSSSGPTQRKTSSYNGVS